MKGAGFLAHGYKAFFPSHRGILVKLALPLGNLPLWHSNIFLNKHRNTCFPPILVKHGILTISQLFDDNPQLHSHALKYISHTWLPIY